ncbi:MAG TPA: DNA-formamidopyrimidine glycosylase [Verrucomicrobia bacterium]|nr:DNA-formamidopyrimidine glycosylase [Verrucomicrobiota bacterium]
MPELPEVETVVRGLRDAALVGGIVRASRVSWARTLGGMPVPEFERRIRGRRIEAIQRRGKYIVIPLDGGLWLLIHLRMTGNLSVKQADEPRDAHERVALVLEDQRELRFRDARKFGRWTLTDTPEVVLGPLGPEPLSAAFRPAPFRLLMQAHARMLKPLLLDQHVIVGLGNIYVDEALWEARLHPCRIASSLSPVACNRLYAAIRKVLQRGVDGMGTTLGRGAVNFYSVAGHRGSNQDALNVFRRDGEPCPHCGTLITRITVAQRSTHLCPRCQPCLHLA